MLSCVWLSMWPHRLRPTRLLCARDSPGKNNRVDSHFLLLGIFVTHGLNLRLWHCRQILYHLSHQGTLNIYICPLLSRFSRVWLFETVWITAHQAPLSMGFSRQEHWSGLPFPSPGDLPNLGIKPKSPALAGGFFNHCATCEGPFPCTYVYLCMCL